MFFRRRSPEQRVRALEPRAETRPVLDEPGDPRRSAAGLWSDSFGELATRALQLIIVLAVSYTHLDVYKRQATKRARRCPCRGSANRLDPRLLKERPLKYISTRGGMRPATYSEALLEGLAPDGGLAVPETMPRLSLEQIDGWRSLSYPCLLYTSRCV